LHWRRSCGDYNAIVKRGNDRTSHQGQLISKLEDTNGITLTSDKDRQYNGQFEKGQKDKQRSTKHTHKTIDRVTRAPLKTEDELMCSGRVGSSCSTSDTVALI
jgi:spore coat protein CotH